MYIYIYTYIYIYIDILIVLSLSLYIYMFNYVLYWILCNGEADDDHTFARSRCRRLAA